MSDESSLFTVRNILFIKDYEFEDDSSKDKILIVLDIKEGEKETTNVLVLQALTTSKVKVPDDRIHHGCTNNAESALSFFMFEGKRVVGSIGEKEFSFDEHTFIHFRENLGMYSKSSFQKYIDADKVSVLGELNRDEYERLIKCIVKSKLVKRGLKKHFDDIKLDTSI